MSEVETITLDEARAELGARVVPLEIDARFVDGVTRIHRTRRADGWTFWCLVDDTRGQSVTFRTRAEGERGE